MNRKWGMTPGRRHHWHRPAVWVVCLLVGVGLIGCQTAQVSPSERKRGEALRNLGEAYLKEGNYVEALRELLKSLEVYPDDPFLHHDLGLVYWAKDRPDLAVRHFQRAVELNPDYAPAINNLGVIYLELDRLDDAIACFKKVSENLLYGTPQFPLLNLGRAYFQKKDYEQAAAYYRKTIAHYDSGVEKDAVYVKAVHALSRTYVALNRYDQAVDLLTAAIEAVPQMPMFYFDLGEIFAAQNDFAAAQKAYRGGLKVAPQGSPIARKIKEALEHITP